MISKNIMHDEKGAIGIMSAIILLFLLGITGLALDYSRASIVKIKVAGALDAGSIAASTASSRGLSDQNQLKAIAKRYYDGNYEANYMMSNMKALPEFKIEGNTIKGSVSNVEMANSFADQNNKLQIASENEVGLNKSGGVDIAFAIDTSCSMDAGWGTPPKGEARIVAARRVLSRFVAQIFKDVPSARFYAVAFDDDITTINAPVWRGARPNLPVWSTIDDNANFQNRMRALKTPFRDCKTTTYHGIDNAREALVNLGNTERSKVLILVYDGAPTTDEALQNEMQDRIADVNDAIGQKNQAIRDKKEERDSCVGGGGGRGGACVPKTSAQKKALNGEIRELEREIDDLEDRKGELRNLYRRRAIETYHQAACTRVKNSGDIQFFSVFIGGNPNHTLVQAGMDVKGSDVHARWLRSHTIGETVNECAPSFKKVFTPQSAKQMEYDMKKIAAQLSRIRMIR